MRWWRYSGKRLLQRKDSLRSRDTAEEMQRGAGPNSAEFGQQAVQREDADGSGRVAKTSSELSVSLGLWWLFL